GQSARFDDVRATEFRWGHCRFHVFPRRASTAKQPRQCGPGSRRWSRISKWVHPASIVAHGAGWDRETIIEQALSLAEVEPRSMLPRPVCKTVRDPGVDAEGER